MRYDLIPRLMRPLMRSPTWIEGTEDDWSAFTDTTGLTIYEDDETIAVEAAVPGIDPKDSEVTYERGMLWIRACAEEKEEDKQRKYYRRASRSFSYRLSITENVDTSTTPNVTAKNGIVTVTFAKAVKVEPKRIPVQGT